jgi:hypothetical protein
MEGNGIMAACFPEDVTSDELAQRAEGFERIARKKQAPPKYGFN